MTPKIIKFKHTLEEGPVSLKLKRTGKDLTQTVMKDGEIVKDQVLCIKEIFIDEIDIASLVFISFVGIRVVIIDNRRCEKISEK